MAAGRDIVGRGHMKDAFVMFVALGFSAGFSFMIVYSSIEYYTTWALAVHILYFMSFVGNHIWYGDNSTITRWGFAPGFCISVTVAAAVIYLITSKWSELFNEYCAESETCYNLMLEFMITHYTPPFAYLFVYLLDGTVLSDSRKRPVLLWWYQWILLVQASLVPACVYAALFDMEAVYGQGTKHTGMLLYAAITVVWSLVWCTCFKD
jgi:hypothetical protein